LGISARKYGFGYFKALYLQTAYMFIKYATISNIILRLITHKTRDIQIVTITYRHNKYLRPLLIEASWQAVRTDASMLDYYQEKCLTGNSKKAIVKVARKLLSKIMYVWLNRIAYERGIA